MDFWQMECCGTPFSVGDEVSWLLRPADTTALGWPGVVLDGVTVDAIEDHHGDAEAPQTVGTVTSIATAHYRLATKPVPGSGIVTPVDTAERWNDDRGDHRFGGFLIGLLVTTDPTAG